MRTAFASAASGAVSTKSDVAADKFDTFRRTEDGVRSVDLRREVIKNPDFVAYARAFGGFGITVEKTEDFPAAFRAAQASGKPAVIQLKIDPDAITPSTTLTKIGAAARAKQKS